MMLWNGGITMILEKPVLRFLLFRTPHIMTNIWKIKLFPNPVGKTAITSIQLKRWHIDSSCSTFNVKPRSDSLSFGTRFNTIVFVTLELTRNILLENLSPVNHCDCAAPIRSPRSWANGFSKIGDFFFLPSVSCPNFRADCLRQIVSKVICRTGTLATQANLWSFNWFKVYIAFTQRLFLLTKSSL